MSSIVGLPPGIVKHSPSPPLNSGDAIQTIENIPFMVFDIIALVNRESRKLKDADDDTVGGWEGWLQVELAYALRNTIGTTIPRGYSIEREKRTYYNQRQRIDIFCRGPSFFDDTGKCIKPHDAVNAHPSIGVELKAGTGYKDHETGTVYSFPKRVMEDIEKIQDFNPNCTLLCGARVFAIGVTFAPEVYGYGQVLKPGYEPVRYTMAESGAYVVWWYKDFP